MSYSYNHALCGSSESYWVSKIWISAHYTHLQHQNILVKHFCTTIKSYHCPEYCTSWISLIFSLFKQTYVTRGTGDGDSGSICMTDPHYFVISQLFVIHHFYPRWLLRVPLIQNGRFCVRDSKNTLLGALGMAIVDPYVWPTPIILLFHNFLSYIIFIQDDF